MAAEGGPLAVDFPRCARFSGAPSHGRRAGRRRRRARLPPVEREGSTPLYRRITRIGESVFRISELRRPRSGRRPSRRTGAGAEAGPRARRRAFPGCRHAPPASQGASAQLSRERSRWRTPERGGSRAAPLWNRAFDARVRSTNAKSAAFADRAEDTRATRGRWAGGSDAQFAKYVPNGGGSTGSRVSSSAPSTSAVVTA